MSRILMSWIAYNHDFTFRENGVAEFNPVGTHGDCYTHEIFKYKEHVLLTKASKPMEDFRFERIVEGIKTFGKNVTPRYLNIDKEDVVNVEVLVKKVEKVLAEYANDDVEAYISPGTPAMQTAWYLLAYKFKNLKLFQVQPPKFRNGKPPKKIDIKILKSIVPTGISIMDASVRRPKRKNSKDICRTPSIQKAFDLATKVAQTYDSSALILGETGTGKEYIARYIHEESGGRAKKGNFIVVDCASMNNEDILESRLFGTVELVFTGVGDNKGAFREADGGTIFLDEIGEVSPILQQTLLRVLESSEVIPVGDYSKKYKIDVRVIAATHRNLKEMVEAGTFRRDLYHRLRKGVIRTIPYRLLPPEEQKEIFEHQCKRVEKKHETLGIGKFNFSKGVLQFIENYKFPGNMRELLNLLEELYIYNEGNQIQVEDLPEDFHFPATIGDSLKLKDVQLQHILKVYRMCKGNLTKTAECLGEGGGTGTIRPIIKDARLKGELLDF